MPPNRSGRPVPAPISVTESDEVLLANSAFVGANFATLPKQLELQRHRLRRRLDHQVGLLDRGGEVGVEREALLGAVRVGGRQLAERDPLVEVLVDRRSAFDSSRRRRRKHGVVAARAATWAMPRPIVPAPRTAMFWISTLSPFVVSSCDGSSGLSQERIRSAGTVSVRSVSDALPVELSGGRSAGRAAAIGSGRAPRARWR